MMWSRLMAELAVTLPAFVAGILQAIWAGVFLFIGYQWGHRRGVNDRPERLGEKWREEQFRRKVLEVEVDSQEQTIRTLRIALQELAAKRAS